MALAADMPILAICRGLQVLNIAAGGGLLQHVDGHQSPKDSAKCHDIDICSGTTLARVLDTTGPLPTNTYHHQAVTLDMLAPGCQVLGGRIGPSHAHIHMVQMNCDANIFGMLVHHDDVIHADFHGAVVIPADAVRKLPAAIDLVSRREKVILDVTKTAGFSSRMLRDALKRSGEIH